ncbi:hypothetical protein [Rhodomicrobium sp. R_RK_3]|nr:hypothetical protein [Rhodomicrobium sp. R_RK_3]
MILQILPHDSFKERPLLDFTLIAIGVGFFVVAAAFAYVCDRL